MESSPKKSESYSISRSDDAPSSEKVTLQVEVPRAEAGAFMELWRDVLAGKVSVFTPELVTQGASYAELRHRVRLDPAASKELKHRIEYDATRDPADTLSEAEFLHAAMLVRFAEVLPPQGAAGSEPPTRSRDQRDRAKAAQQAGVDALGRLLKVAQGNSGQCRRIAHFLLSLYNGERFPFDLTDLRSIDDELFEDCMRVLRMDARHCQKEVHAYFPNGGRIWEQLARDWGIGDVQALRRIATQVIERGVKYGSFTDDGEAGEAALVVGLKKATCYREKE